MERIPQSAALRVTFKAYLSSDHVSAASGSGNSAVAVQISKNGGGFADPAAGATKATEIASGWYYVDLAAGDTGTLGPLVVRATQATIDPAEVVYEVAVLGTVTGYGAGQDPATLLLTHPAKLIPNDASTGKLAATLGAIDYSGNTPQTGDAYAYAQTFLPSILQALQLSQVHALPAAERPAIVLFNDFAADIDGAYALCIINELHNCGALKLLGVVSDFNEPLAAQVVDALDSFYGNVDIPIGIFNGTNLETVLEDYEAFQPYYEALCAACPQRNGTYTEAVALTRQLLAGQADGSVTLVTCGPLMVLAGLLASAANYGGDGLGSGIALITAKVKQLNLGGGRPPSGTGATNLTFAPAQAAAVLAAWPSSVPLIYVGENLAIGGEEEDSPYVSVTTITAGLWPNHPFVWLAFSAGVNPNPPPPAYIADKLEIYDVVRALYAAYGLCGVFQQSAAGTGTVDGEGNLTFSIGAGNQYYLTYASNFTEAQIIGMLTGQLLIAAWGIPLQSLPADVAAILAAAQTAAGNVPPSLADIRKADQFSGAFPAGALENAPTGATVTNQYAVTAASAGVAPRLDLFCQQFMRFGPFEITSAQSQTGKEHTLLVYDPAAPAIVLWSLDSEQIAVADTLLTVEGDDTNSGTAGTWAYRLLNVTDDYEICRGALVIEPGPDVPAEPES